MRWIAEKNAAGNTARRDVGRFKGNNRSGFLMVILEKTKPGTRNKILLRAGLEMLLIFKPAGKPACRLPKTNAGYEMN
ncbi:MAG: hypothetical protein PHX45_01965 [Acidobacteriota bacterium]|nr:hypothetical protein [Acidobacteriota bacterium]